MISTDTAGGIVSLRGKRVLVTQAREFMGPELCSVLAEAGADVVADDSSLIDSRHACGDRRQSGTSGRAGGEPGDRRAVDTGTDVDDAEWQSVFRHLVDPLPRLVRAVLPQMIERRSGRILVIGSASALRGMKRASTYSAARGAQLAYVQAVGVEVAPHNVQVNAIAQNFVENPTYFPPEVQAMPAFQDRLKREVPLGRLVGAREDALFAAYLCSAAADCFVGQVFPVCGGWVVR